MKFNPGDKVVLVRENHWSERDQLKIGQIYTVKDNDGSNIKLAEGAVGYWFNYNQFKKVVTTVDIGAKVVRGKDWEWGDQDKNSIYGIIDKASSIGWAKVAWQSKQGITIRSRGAYRVGDDKYDLYYYDGPEIVTTEPVFVPPIITKPEPLVFDKYKVGDIVVSLINIQGSREEGEMFEVLKDSEAILLSYKTNHSRTSRNSTNTSSWRAATEYEVAAFKRGITNINEIIPEPVTEDIPYKELEGKFVRCIKNASYAHEDYYYDRYYFVSEVTKCSIRIVDKNHNYSWSNDSAGSIVRIVFDLSKGYTYDEVKDKIDEVALKRAVNSCFKIPALLISQVEFCPSDVSSTVERPTSTKHKPDASFQVAFVETQLRKPGKKTKIKF
jgi:hypothetical protein